MKKLFVLLLLVVFGSSVPAQEEFHEVDHLTKGYSQQDLLVEQIPDGFIEMIPTPIVAGTIGTGIRNFYTGKMSKNEEDADENPENDTRLPAEPIAGFEGIVTLAYQVGVGDYGLSRLKLNLSAGYRVDPQILLGAGIGARQYPDLKATFLPVYAEFRGWLLTSRVSPYFSFQVGTMFHISEDFKNVGIFAAPNLGVSTRFSDGTAMHFSLGYEYQRMGFYRQALGYVFKFNENCGAVSFNIGFAF